MTKRTLAIAGLAALLAAPPLAAQPDELEDRVARLEEAAAAEEPAAWTFDWKNTFRLTSPDGRIRLRFGGRVQNDWAALSGDDEVEAAFGELGEGTEFRRARLYFDGRLHDRVEFKAEYDFAGGDAAFKDVYLGLVELPGVGGLRAGHFKEPWSLEEQTSSKYLTFLERSLPVEAFSPSRNTGFMVHDGRERVQWAVGAFKEADDFGDALSDDWSLTGRVSGLPWRTDESHLVHLGLAASRREPLGGQARFRSRPESHLAPRFADTGNLAVDTVTQLNGEALLVHGPFSLQGEWTQAAADRLGGAGDADLDGFYVFASWFPTGEHRPYDGGDIGRVTPLAPWGEGPGAWEIAVRYSSLDLTDAGVAGGELDDVTVGLNWYPYPNVRWMLDYTLADRDGIGDADLVGMRLQFDF